MESRREFIRAAVAIGALWCTRASAQFALPAEPTDLSHRLDGFSAEVAEGFEWQKLEDLGAAIQIPIGWHRNAKRGSQFKTVAFSKAPLNLNGMFDIGFTASVMWGANGTVDPVRLLYADYQGIKSNPRSTVIRDSFKTAGERATVIVRYRNAPDGEVPIIVHKMYVADRADRVLWIFTFESPEAQWEEEWKLGQQILSRVYLPTLARR